MNIFYLDKSPKISAQYHCDKHVVKMIIESAQLLYCAHWILNPEGVPTNAYKKCHVNHPSAIWVRESICNYLWLSSLAWWLCKEYQYRYGEQKVHATEQHIVWLLQHTPKSIPNIEPTKLRLAMPNEYKLDDPIESYKLFYIESKMKKRNIVKYTKRPWPKFLLST